MFLISVFVPSSFGTGRTHRDVGIATQRAFLHLHVADAQHEQRPAQRFEVGDRIARAMQLGLGDALHQRNAGTIEIEQGIGAAGDAAVARARVRRFPRVFFQMDAREAATLQRTVVEPIRHLAADRQRHVVLRDLVILGHVGIEVVLAIELRERGNLRAEGEPRTNDVRRAPVRWAPAARRAFPDRRGRLRIRLAAELVEAAAEHLRLRLELDVTLDADDGFVLRHARTPASSGLCARA